jgi:hypothetical protein
MATVTIDSSSNSSHKILAQHFFNSILFIFAREVEFSKN